MEITKREKDLMIMAIETQIEVAKHLNTMLNVKGELFNASNNQIYEMKLLLGKVKSSSLFLG